jgi:hypothetical protein
MNIKGVGRKRFGLMRYYGEFEGTEEKPRKSQDGKYTS